MAKGGDLRGVGIFVRLGGGLKLDGACDLQTILPNLIFAREHFIGWTRQLRTDQFCFGRRRFKAKPLRRSLNHLGVETPNAVSSLRCVSFVFYLGELLLY